MIMMGLPLIMAFTFLGFALQLLSDYTNMYEATSKINRLIVPDFALQGFLCVLLLLTGHWFMFLVSFPITCYHVMLYVKQQHLIDVTEIFVFLVRKKYCLVKLSLPAVFFVMVVFRFGTPLIEIVLSYVAKFPRDN